MTRNNAKKEYLLKFKNSMLPLSVELYEELVKEYGKRLEI
tara:strand:- start:396 stop:515 length:120 start_codon:yes stop_codon:yes gene_type:complete